MTKPTNKSGIADDASMDIMTLAKLVKKSLTMKPDIVRTGVITKQSEIDAVRHSLANPSPKMKALNDILSD